MSITAIFVSFNSFQSFVLVNIKTGGSTAHRLDMRPQKTRTAEVGLGHRVHAPVTQ